MIKLKQINEAKKFETIREYINSAIEKYADKNAFIIKNKKNDYKYITYKQLGEDIENLGTGLLSLGLENKRIAIIGKNSYEWALSYISIFNGVGITVPLDKGLQENEIIMSLDRSKADAVIFEKSYIDIMKRIEERPNNTIKHFICMNPENNNVESLEDLINKGKELIKSGDKSFKNHKINPNDMATIIFTSGTTSMSKAVTLYSLRFSCICLKPSQNTFVAPFDKNNNNPVDPKV